MTNLSSNFAEEGPVLGLSEQSISLTGSSRRIGGLCRLRLFHPVLLFLTKLRAAGFEFLAKLQTLRRIVVRRIFCMLIDNVYMLFDDIRGVTGNGNAGHDSGSFTMLRGGGRRADIRNKMKHY